MKSINKIENSFVETPIKGQTDSEITNYGYSLISSGNQNASGNNKPQLSIFSDDSYARNKSVAIYSNKLKNLAKQKSTQRILNKIFMTKYFNAKFSLQKLRQLSEHGNQHVDENEPIQQIVFRDIIKKTKLTTQTSFMRSIISLEASEKIKKQRDTGASTEIKSIKNNQINLLSSTNVTIYPNQFGPHAKEIKYAILRLQMITKDKFKFMINQFHINSRRCSFIDGYFLRVFKRGVDNQRIFIQKIKTMAKIKHDQILTTKRKLLRDFLNKSLKRRERLILNTIVLEQKQQQVTINEVSTKKNVLRLLIKISQQKLFRSFVLWNRKSKLLTQQLQKVDRKSIQNQISVEIIGEPISTSLANIDCGTQTQIQIDEGEEKKHQKQIEESQHKLQKMITILKYYYEGRSFDNIVCYVRRIKMLEKCAIKLACGPKVSVHRSLWRMNIYTYHDVN